MFENILPVRIGRADPERGLESSAPVHGGEPQPIGALSVHARDADPPAAPTALADEAEAEAAVAETIPQLREMLGPIQETVRGMLEAEDALRLVRQRFEQSGDPEVREELAAEAL